jgi:serine/threonine-protein kinase
VIGKNKDAAVAELQGDPFRMQVAGVQERYDDLYPAGVVVATNPEAGKEVKPGAQITLVVSKGRAPITVPSVVGLQFGEAAALLQSLGLKVTQEPVTDSAKPQGEVLEQTPAAGSGAEKNTEVRLKVSANVNNIPMPSVMNVGCQDAKRQLEGMGLRVDVNAGPIEQWIGHVIKQEPEAGKGVQPGQLVRITCK